MEDLRGVRANGIVALNIRLIDPDDDQHSPHGLSLIHIYMDLPAAKAEAAAMLPVLEALTADQLHY